ncbi:hypothetical protein EYC84_004222 [Monilinia fructicola]|uniref:Uncharacterized protein n=1 Tax=Monilinia fructicola TaxID=38448 RepID=A0A5M9K260_MONFR|nr:hypothetical protein EYC84_004222 [Monilinia fructicola]
MSKKSNYGRAQQAPDAQKYAEGEFAAKRLAAKFKDMQMAIAYQNTMSKFKLGRMLWTSTIHVYHNILHSMSQKKAV